jgi:hypothetical protein
VRFADRACSGSLLPESGFRSLPARWINRRGSRRRSTCSLRIRATTTRSTIDCPRERMAIMASRFPPIDPSRYSRQTLSSSRIMDTSMSTSLVCTSARSPWLGADPCATTRTFAERSTASARPRSPWPPYRVRRSRAPILPAPQPLRELLATVHAVHLDLLQAGHQRSQPSAPRPVEGLRPSSRGLRRCAAG